MQITTNGPVTYREGERLLADWRPQITLFLTKLALVAFLTMLFLGPLWSSHGFLTWMASALATMVAYVFLFDDHLEWFRRRDDVWLLTDQRLIFVNPDDDNAPASVDLQDITRVRRWMWWALHVRLDNGMTTTMKYLPDTKHVEQSIRAARDNIAPPFPK